MKRFGIHQVNTRQQASILWLASILREASIRVQQASIFEGPIIRQANIQQEISL